MESYLRKPIIRVTGGKFGGRHLEGASGSTRPATAQMREAIFNRPDVLSVVHGRVLDLYAGAGLLGLEALSRGARFVDFVEREPRACSIIRNNLSTLGLTDFGDVHPLMVENCLERLNLPYDLCFIDPPYELDSTSILVQLLEIGILRVGGLLLWRHPIRNMSEKTLGSLARVDQRRYGDAVLDTYTAGVPT